MEKFEKFKIKNQQSVVGGDLERTMTNNADRDLWDSDNKRLILFN